MNKALTLLILLFLLGCQSKENSETSATTEASDLMAIADSLAHAYIITDGHVDLPYRLKETNFDLLTDGEILLSTEEGDFDYERAKKGGLDAPFMSIYIPAEYQVTGGAKELADSLIDMVEGITKLYPEKFALAVTPEEVRRNFTEGKISLPMGMENGAPIGDNLSNVEYFRNRGIRYITLTHSKNNLICDSSYDTTRLWNGLSPFGQEVVKEMNRVGIMVDISHVSDSTFYDVMDLTDVPVIASHSSCRHFTPGFERNMADDMIRRLGEENGVIQINFGSTFLDEHSQKVSNDLGDFMESHPDLSDSARDAYRQKFMTDNNFWSNVSKVADHIDHVVELAGIDHVAIGSDYDGVGDSLPVGLKDVSMFPNLIAELLKRGYSYEDIEKICYKNVFRVWQAVEDAASI
ncbi:dipeptidase [Fulvivirga sedimenti]|uniref:Dipeptidase n=1 Tax=Fulvivirga sedimenti TaxID=2879465 RepID=A0A9X1KV56_9BACT|nr:dipeptidase [Fulvivirga sedimenti]MCA6074358.1 dipeptidase [Fulvivirga sedimenti]